MRPKREERAEQRLEHPQTLWDVLCGLILVYRDGGIVAARNYLRTQGKLDSAAPRCAACSRSGPTNATTRHCGARRC